MTHDPIRHCEVFSPSPKRIQAIVEQLDSYGHYTMAEAVIALAEDRNRLHEALDALLDVLPIGPPAGASEREIAISNALAVLKMSRAGPPTSGSPIEDMLHARENLAKARCDPWVSRNLFRVKEKAFLRALAKCPEFEEV